MRCQLLVSFIGDALDVPIVSDVARRLCMFSLLHVSDGGRYSHKIVSAVLREFEISWTGLQSIRSDKGIIYSNWH